MLMPYQVSSLGRAYSYVLVHRCIWHEFGI
nr:MAG TPA: NUMOD4 motif protein [Caudoviricetes sp.]